VNEYRSVLERAGSNFAPLDLELESLLRRRDRKRRNQRIAAGVVGIAVFVAAVWVVTSVGSLDRSEAPAVPGPAETGPAEPNCVVTRCTETGPAVTATKPGYLIDLNTGEMTQLPKSIAGCCYAASPDGTMVAYISLDDAGMSQFFIARVDGTDVQQVTQRGAWGPFDWSPDGAAIAYPSGWEEDVINIFVLDLATGETSQVTHEKPPTGTCGPTVGVPCGPQGAVFPQFSPDGASIVYKVYRGGDQDVRIVPVTGGKSVLLVDGATVGTLSPDGSTLAVGGCGRRLGSGLCIAHADGTNLRALVSGPQLFGPKWSPDGTRIAYNDQADGPRETKSSWWTSPRARPPSWPTGSWTIGSTTTRSSLSPFPNSRSIPTPRFLGRLWPRARAVHPAATPFTSEAASSAWGAGGSAEPASRVHRWRIPPTSSPHLLTDNGCVYTTWHRGGPNVMQTELLALGIEFRHSRPYHPQTCGKVERFHQTMKAFLARQPPAGSIAELQAQVDRFVAYYNEVRPHRARKRRPPRVAFEARAKARPRGPMIRVGAGVRVRRDRIDNNGKVTLRQPDPPAITSAWDTPTRAKARHHVGERSRRPGGVPGR